MKLRKALFIALGLSAAFAQAQDQKVTFEAKAAPAGQILRALSKEAGVTLSADSVMSREVLLICVKDVTLKDVMDRIAKVSAGLWMTVGSEHRLVPDSGTRQKQQNAVLKRNADALKKSFEELLKTSGGEGEKTASALTLLAMQDPEAVAQIGVGDRVVFSSDPNASQTQIKGLTNDFVDSMMTQLASRDQGVSADHGDNGVVTVSDDDTAAKPKQTPSLVLLAVSNKTGALSTELMAFDDKGRKFAVETMGFSSADAASEPAKAPADAPSLAGPPSKEIQRSDLTTALWANGFDRDSAQPANLGKDGLDAVLHPEKFDPLSFLASDAILQRAHECGEQLVADLPDCIAFDSAGTGAEYLKTEIEAGKISLSDDKNWILVSPGAPVASRIYRADRHALQVLVTAANAKGEVPLEDLAAFALAEGHAPLRTGLEQDASSHYLHLLVPNLMNLDEGGNKLNGLRLYGLLSSDQREALSNGEKVSVGDLSSNAMEALRDLVYGAEAQFQTEAPAVPAQDGVVPAPSSTYLEEPTLSMADGVPPEAEISLNQSGGNGSGELRLDFHLLPPLWLHVALEGFRA